MTDVAPWSLDPRLAQDSIALGDLPLSRVLLMNVAALGNKVRQLHVHVIARRNDDPAGARPVWGTVPARPYAAAERERLSSEHRSALALA